MMKMLLFMVSAVLVAIVIVAALKPSAFKVQREIVIQAAPGKIFPLLSDFHRWGAWSPFEKLDPAMQKTFSGPATGPGSAYAWEGNRKAGQGRMEISEMVPNAKLTIKLDFTKPMRASNTIEFSLEPQGQGTQVTWAMLGSYPFIGKVMSLFFNMDQMVGKDFETGLANLKAAAEK